MRVATYNVHACIGTDGRHDPDRIARVITELDADLVALQEFTYPASVALETRTPVVLTTLDRYECALGPTRERTRASRTECFGNALLTRRPLAEVHRIDLSTARREPRGAVAATIEAGDGTRIHVLAAHLGLRLGERRFQVGQILDYLDSIRNDVVIVLGDFNDWLPGRSAAHVMDERLGRPPQRRSFPSSRPLVALDRIWVHPLTAMRRIFAYTSPLARRASDHLPVVADLDVSLALSATASGGGEARGVQPVGT
jgi:endonuclease/exonuclease/phosphatase family metal-dependent hydrolase